MEKISMESTENLSAIEQFKFDLRAVVTRLSALKDLSRNLSYEDFENYKMGLEKLDVFFENHTESFSDSELIKFSDLLNEAEKLLERLETQISPSGD